MQEAKAPTDFIVGLDIAKAKVDACLRLPTGKWRTKVVANSVAGFQELAAWLGRHGAAHAHVCMEATGTYWEAIAQHLSDAGHALSVVNPAQIKAYGTALGVRSKTDAADAKLIAQFCAARPPALWQAPPPAVRQLKALVARREALIELRIQETNRLEVAHDSVRASIEGVIKMLEEQIRQIEQRIGQHIDDDPTLAAQRELLDSVPGLGEVTIATLLSHFGGAARFATAKQAVAFAGLDVRHHESGSSVRSRPRLSKRGNSKLRKAMYMPALVSMRLTPWGKAFASRLSAAGKPKMVILGAIMRKLIQIAYAVLRTGKPFDPTLHSA
jgi:transposase